MKITENNLYEVIGMNIKYYRALHNLENDDKLTQEKLAEAVGVAPSVIGGLESKKVDQGISVPNLWKIGKYLNVSVDKLMELPPNYKDK